MLKCDDSLKHAFMTMNLSDWEAYRILRQEVKSNIRATESKQFKEELPHICPTSHQYGKLSVDVSTRMLVPTYCTLGTL